MSYINNYTKIIENLVRFKLFVNSKDGNNGPISFRSSNSFLGQEEDYKSDISEAARRELNFKNWNKSWIGTGKINQCAIKAINKCGNLVNVNQITHFKNILNPNNSKYNPNAEKVLYNIYSNPSCDEKSAFEDAVKIFGAKYDLIAFLFFIKDDTRFLPTSSGHFDKAFKKLGIDYIMSFNCNFDNYKGFIEIINEIRYIMEDVLEMEGSPRLIDAHSFVWIIQGEKYNNWNPNNNDSAIIEQMTEEAIQKDYSGSGKKKVATSTYYLRSKEVVDETKRRAKGICQLCNNPAPFLDNEGKPYLEAHHVIWLSRGGLDSTTNTVALCPNCHKRMHILDEKKDVDKLLNLLKK